jgi:energy-coupling factor transporter ATP-binding protein EcfA2
MSKIIQLTAENVKRLHAVQITPSGHLVIVGGRNGQGKTSVLDAIAMIIGGKDEIPTVPVRKGQKKATIIADLGDLIVKRTITAEGGGQLVVENKDRMRASSPQALLDGLTGKLTFDPLAFCNLERKAQAAALKRLVGVDFSALEAKRATLYAERTNVNRDAERQENRAEFLPQHAGAPAEEQSVTAIVEERDAAKEHNAKKIALERAVRESGDTVETTVKGRDALLAEIEQAQLRLNSLRAQLPAYDEKLPSSRTRLADAQSALLAFNPIDLSPINLRLAQAEHVNHQVRQNKARAEALAEAQATKAKAESLTQQIEAIDKEKDTQLAAIKMPIDGLSFDQEGGVTYNGLPFDQASAAERMRVSVAIAAAMNPKLRVMLVRDASLLDDDGLALLAKLAEEFDLQVWAERVGKGAECSVIIEDGAVQVAPPAAVEGEDLFAAKPPVTAEVAS